MKEKGNRSVKVTGVWALSKNIKCPILFGVYVLNIKSIRRFRFFRASLLGWWEMSKADYEIVASWMEVVWVTVIMFLSTKLSNNVQNAISIVNNCKSFLLLHQQPEYPSPRFDSGWKKLFFFTEYPLNTQDVLRAPRKLEMDEGKKEINFPLGW